MTFQNHLIAHNYNTFGIECLMDLPVTTNTFAHSDFQQLINKEQPILFCRSEVKLSFATSTNLDTHNIPIIGRDWPMISLV